MGKVEQYCVVSEENRQSFDRSVNEYIGDGWQPIGGVSVTVVHIKGGAHDRDWYEYLFCQSMGR